ncbi:Ras and EF-hand domain-containing protein [Clonorchis sinensis]|uniref:Ras and EF-hand domain-containing protein n=1 Tax=Clonorchis sinensis TaxID=79923 RepID=G7YAP1_CLOSI|nr:Ras and EF-hand domain-containing protein [Clonorchis sinensis]
MESDSSVIGEARILFSLCDPDGRGFITRQDFDRVKEHLPLEDDQLDAIFDVLDENNEGYVTSEVFLKGFGQFFSKNREDRSVEISGSSGQDSDEENHKHALKAVGADVLLKDYEQISRIWKQLKRDNPPLLSDFERMLTGIAKELETAKSEHQTMDQTIQKKLCKQEEHLSRMYEELEQQLNQEKERLSAQEREKERKVREELMKKVQFEERLAADLTTQYEEALARLEEIGNIHAMTQQERDQLTQEKDTLEKRLQDTQSALEDCKEYIATLQKKAREDKRNRAKAAIELSQNIALERENLVRQLDSLRLINRKLLDDREERNHRRVSGTVQSTSILREGETIPLPLTDPEEPGKYGTVICRIRPDHVGLVCDTEFGKTDSRSMDSTGISKARRGSIMAAYFGPALPRRGSSENDLIGITEAGEVDNEEVFKTGGSHIAHNLEYLVRWSSVQGPFGSVDEVKVGTVRPGSVAVDQLSFRSNDDAVSRSQMAQRVFKVTFVGDSNVGKSSIIHRFVEGEFKSNLGATVGVDVNTKFVECDNVNVILQLWDTAGLERFRGLTRQYYRRADAVILVYDVTNTQSFLSVRKWVQEVRDNTDEYTVLMILSNKLDLLPEVPSEQYPTTNDLDALCKENDAIGFEVSAASGQNIELAFNDLTK